MPSKKRISEFLSGTSGVPVGGSTEKPFEVRNPLVVMFEQDQKIVCHIHPRKTDNYKGYGLLICDLVRHIANAFHAEEDDVWEWVDKERNHHTTDITQAS